MNPIPGNRRSGFQVMMQLIGLVGPLLPYMIMAITAGILGFVCANFLTILGAKAMLEVSGVIGFGGFPLWILLTLVIFALMRGVLRYAEQLCNHYIAFKLLALLREKVFIALRRLCPAKLEGKDKGDLISLITTDIELLEVFYAHTISPVAIAIGMSIIMTIYIAGFHPVLGLIAALAYIVVGWVLPVTISKMNGTLGAQFRGTAGKMSGFMLDSLRGLREILQYGRGKERLQEMMDRSLHLSAAEKQLKEIGGHGGGLTNLVLVFFNVAMLVAAGVLYHNGTIEVEAVILSVIAMMGSFGPVVALAALGSTLQQTIASGDRVLNLLQEAPQVEERLDGATPVFAGASLDGVDFRYDDQAILSDFSLEIPRGQVLGIVGKSGSGKSTMLRLLMRFWDVQKGAVNVSGEDVRGIRTSSLRDMESFMTQETHLFKDSIAANLRIVKEDATQEELEAACRKASIHDFIMSLPKGYDTPVGELGDTVSGGERQRLGLARAFLHDAPMMLLDEPTSNLDSLNEGVVLKSIDEYRKDKTVVLVSHRASTVAIADRICAMESGRLS